MFQNEILIEVLLVHFVDLGGVHEVNDLTDTIDRLVVVKPDAVSDPCPYSRLRLSEGYESGRIGIRTFAEIGKPRCGIVLDQGGTGNLALGKILMSNGFISRRGLAVELSFAFFLFFKLANLTIFFLFGFCFHVHR